MTRNVYRPDLSSPAACVGLGEDREVVLQGEKGAQLAVPARAGPGHGSVHRDGHPREGRTAHVTVRLLHCGHDGASVTGQHAGGVPLVHFC